MKRSLKLIMTALTALIVPALGWAVATATYTWDTADNRFEDADGNAYTFPAGFTGEFKLTAKFTMPNVTSATDDILVFYATKEDESNAGALGLNTWSGSVIKYVMGTEDSVGSGGHYSNARLHNSGNGENTVIFTVTEFAEGKGKVDVHFIYASGGEKDQAEIYPNRTFSADAFAFDSMTLLENAALVSDNLPTLEVTPIDSYSRTIDANADWSSEATWTNIADDTKLVAAPAENDKAILTFNSDAAITMNAEANLKSLTVGGSAKATFVGDAKLTSVATSIHTDTDVSGITAELGNVTIAAEKELKLKGPADIGGNFFVSEGATLDLNGARTGVTSVITLCNGATLTTAQVSGNETNWIACPSINLYNASTAAKITGASISSVASQNAAHPWYLNGGTLEFALNSDATSDATFYASSINVLKSSGSTEKAGTLKMTSGKVKFVQNAASAEHADVVLNGGEVIVSLNNNSTYKFGSLSGDSGTLRVGTPLEVGALNTDTAAAITITAATESSIGTFKKVGTGTLDLSTAHIANIPFEVVAGTLILPASAGKTNTITVAEGATVKFAMTDAEAFSTCSYDTTKVTGSGTITFCFMDEALNAVLDVENSVSGATYTCPASVWVPASADSTFDTAACWTSQTVPTTGAVVINASAYTDSDVAITIPAGITGVAVKGNATVTTKVAFAADVTSYPNISVDGKVELPIAAINSAEQVAVAVGSTLIANVATDTELTKPLAGNFTFWKNGSGTLTLGANVSPDNGSVICEGIVKFADNNSNTTQANELYAFGSNYAAMTGDVRVKTGATLDVNGHKGAWLDTVTLETGATFANTGGTVDGTQRQCVGIVLEGDATVNTGSFFGLVAGSYAATEVTLNNHTLTKTGTGTFLVKNTALSGGTIAIAEGTVEVQKHGQRTTSFSEVTVTGDGTLLFNGLLPGAPAGLTADTWTGTVRIKGFAGTTAQDTSGTSRLRIDSYGHAGSEIELDDVRAYINNGTTAASVTLVGNGFQPNNGSSSSWANIVINQLKGSGALKGATGTTAFKYKFVLNDVSDFSGSINLNTDMGAETAVIIADANVNQDPGTILVAAGKTANIAAEQTWTAYAGKSVIVNGTLSGSGTIDSALTLNAGATLDATAETKLSVTGDVAFPAEGTLTVKLAAGATFPAQIIKKSDLGADDVEGVALSVVIGDAEAVTEGYKLVTTTAGYAVALDITVPDNIVIDGVETELDAGAKAALLAIAKDKGTSITNVVPAEGKTAAEVNNALQIFDAGVVTVDGTTAIVDWDFGISAIERNGANVTITAQVLDTDENEETSVKFAEGVKLMLIDGETPIGKAVTPTDGGTVTFTVLLTDLITDGNSARAFTVKATNETTTTND